MRGLVDVPLAKPDRAPILSKDTFEMKIAFFTDSKTGAAISTSVHGPLYDNSPQAVTAMAAAALGMPEHRLKFVAMVAGPGISVTMGSLPAPEAAVTPAVKTVFFITDSGSEEEESHSIQVPDLATDDEIILTVHRVVMMLDGNVQNLFPDCTDDTTTEGYRAGVEAAEKKVDSMSGQEVFQFFKDTWRTSPFIVAVVPGMHKQFTYPEGYNEFGVPASASDPTPAKDPTS
jgi:hypothetical protein